MKPWIFIAALSASILTAKQLPEVKVIVPLTEINADLANQLIYGNSSELAILCEAGTELPLKMLTKYKLFSIKFAPNITVKIEQTCYVRWYHGKVYFSYDMQDWNEGSDLLGSVKPKTSFSIDKNQILVDIDATQEHSE